MIIRYFLLSYAFIIVVGCSTSDGTSAPSNDDSDPGNDTSESFELIIDMDADYLALSSTVYLSDQDGTIVAQGPLILGQQTVLNVDGPIDAKYDASFYFDWDNGANGTIEGIIILSEIPSGIYTFENAPINPISGEDLMLSIFNIGDPPIRWKNEGQNITSNWSPTNGGTVNFESLLKHYPVRGGTYIALQREQDDFQRYYWSENPPTTQQESVDYFTLPILDDIITMQHAPEIELTEYKLFGLHTTNSADFGTMVANRHFLDEDFLNFGLPPNLFNRYKIWAGFLQNGSGHFTLKRSNSLIDFVDASTIHYDITSKNIQNFNAVTGGNFDTYRIEYSYPETSTDTHYVVAVFGPQSENISFNKGLLVESVFGNGFNAQNLTFDYSRLYEFDNINGYRPYIDKLITNDLYYDSGPGEYEWVYDPE